MKSKKDHLSRLHISNLSLLSNKAHITEFLCEQSLLAFILSERWNDLSTNVTYYKQFHTKKSHKLKPKYFTEFTTKHHKNCLLLSPLPPYPTSQLDVFGHDGDSLGMDGTQVRVFKETHQICFTSLLFWNKTDSVRNHELVHVISPFPHSPTAYLVKSNY